MSEVLILTNDILKSLMPDAMVFRGVSSGGCLEDFTQTGIYRLQGDVKDLTSSRAWPTNMTTFHLCILEVIERGNGDILQRLTQIDHGQTFVSTRRLGVWKPWYRLDMTLVE